MEEGAQLEMKNSGCDSKQHEEKRRRETVYESKFLGHATGYNIFTTIILVENIIWKTGRYVRGSYGCVQIPYAYSYGRWRVHWAEWQRTGISNCNKDYPLDKDKTYETITDTLLFCCVSGITAMYVIV